MTSRPAFDIAVDVAVVGGGLVGLAAAVAAGRSGRSVLHLSPPGPADRRTSALMQPSVRYLRDEGLIGDPAAHGHALTQVRIIDATERLFRAPETLFDCHDAGLEAFGWNFANTGLGAAFEAARAELGNVGVSELLLADLSVDAEAATLTLADGNQVRARLVVGADGKMSRVREMAGFRAREHGFTQAALVCDLSLQRPLGGTSVEFHYAQGPFTLVPAGSNRANLVWIDDRDVLKTAQATGNEVLAALFAEKLQHLFGAVELLTPTHMFPLSSLTVDCAGRDGVVLAGEAAHAFAPIGAQGLNLGLRDVADLTTALAGADFGAPDWARRVSADYAQRRSGDLLRTGQVVDALFRSLLAGMLPAQALRAGGLWALKLLPGLRREAFSVGMGSQ